MCVIPMDCAIQNVENPFPGVLVELIVVLVILAILAAMMVPALLGYIDEARDKQYVLEARSVYMAAQAVADETYGKGGTAGGVNDEFLNEKVNDIVKLSDVTVTDFSGVTVKVGTDPAAKDAYQITGMTIDFTSSNKNEINATLEDGSWTINTITAP